MIFQIKLFLTICFLLVFNQVDAQTNNDILKDSIVDDGFKIVQPKKPKTNVEFLAEAVNEIYHSERYTVEIDSAAQLKYKDTIQSVKIRIHGLWQYQGIHKRYQDDFIDTLYFSDEFVFVKNGVVYFSKNGIETKQTKICVSEFDFSESNFTHPVLIKEVIDKSGIGGFETKTCQPFYSIIYHQKEIGLYSSGMGGQYFEPIKYLSDKVLIFKIEEGLECYLRKE